MCMILLPRFGFSRLTIRIYPCLAAGYFILFLMYSAIIFLYYYDDLTGAALTSVAFCLVTFIGSMIAKGLPELWYGIGVAAGAFTGWTIAYLRLRCMERNLDIHIFCKGSLLKPGMGTQPPGQVFDRRRPDAEANAKQS